MPKRLTQLTIDKLRPPTERVTITDAVLPGFRLRYWKSKIDPQRVDGTYSIRYWSPVTGKQPRYTIGSIHEWDLSEAREEARRLLRDISRGIDPAIEKARQKHSEAADAPPGTISTLIPEFEKRYLSKKRKEPAKVRRTLERELIENKPSWGDWPISEVTRGDIHAKLDRLTDQGKEYAANRLLEAIRLMFKWAVERGYIDDSPAEGIRKPGSEKARQRVLDDGELRQIWAAFESLGYPFGPFFQLLLLTGQRAGEVAGMMWAEIDFEDKLWRIPADRTKADRAHLIPLSPWAIKILKSLPQMTSTEYVFTGRESTGNQISGFSRAGERARQAAGIVDWRPHDLRRTVRTRLGEIGTPPHIAELVLNHAVKGLQAVYDRYEYTKEKREALDKWSAQLKGIISNRGGKVVAFS